jgi:hypothetical protein
MGACVCVCVCVCVCARADTCVCVRFVCTRVQLFCMALHGVVRLLCPVASVHVHVCIGAVVVSERVLVRVLVLVCEMTFVLIAMPALTCSLVQSLPGWMPRLRHNTQE